MNKIQSAIVVGFCFGFVLHRIGATNPNFTLGMLRLRSFYLMKVILLAMAFATLGLFIGIDQGYISISHLSIKSTTYGVPVGGALFGIGWAISGYCPGTSITAVGEGRRDALIYILGCIFGTLLFMLTYKYFSDGPMFDSMMGQISIGRIKGMVTPYMVGMPALYTGLALAVFKIIIASIIPLNRLR